MIESIDVNAEAWDSVGEVPKLVQRYTLGSRHNRENDLVCGKNDDGSLAKTFKPFVVGCDLSASLGCTLPTIPT